MMSHRCWQRRRGAPFRGGLRNSCVARVCAVCLAADARDTRLPQLLLALLQEELAPEPPPVAVPAVLLLGTQMLQKCLRRCTLEAASGVEALLLPALVASAARGWRPVLTQLALALAVLLWLVLLPCRLLVRCLLSSACAIGLEARKDATISAERFLMMLS